MITSCHGHRKVTTSLDSINRTKDYQESRPHSEAVDRTNAKSGNAASQPCAIGGQGCTVTHRWGSVFFSPVFQYFFVAPVDTRISFCYIYSLYIFCMRSLHHTLHGISNSMSKIELYYYLQPLSSAWNASICPSSHPLSS